MTLACAVRRRSCRHYWRELVSLQAIVRLASDLGAAYELETLLHHVCPLEDVAGFRLT
jgi:hypothetical protein